MEWGKEIPVNGVRPTWLPIEQQVDWRADGKTFHGTLTYRAHEWSATDWARLSAIRLPADHFAYAAIDKGFEPWGGGDAAPDDWDEGEVLLRSGYMVGPGKGTNALSWRHPHDAAPLCLREAGGDIIGYRKRAIDTVTIARMTEAEACRKYALLRENGDETAIALLHELGLIREETLAEHFTRETGIAVTPEIEKALSWKK